MSRRIAVVGGGAAGMMAAIWAAYAGAQVMVYERNDRVGKKILSTGNGKCNFSNEVMSPACYHGSGASRAAGIFARFGVEETKDFFRKLGMRIKDKNGYLYPASEQAATVLDVLRYEMERLGIEISPGCLVTGIDSLAEENITAGSTGAVDDVYAGRRTSAAAGYRLRTAGNDVVNKRRYDAVILACGGRAAPKTGSDGLGFTIAKRLGHRIVPTVPALTALRCAETFFKQVAGVRCEARLTLYIDGSAADSVHGELQLTDYGISGIPVFQFSRTAAYALQEGRRVTAKIDFMPAQAAVECGPAGGQTDTEQSQADDFWAQRWERQKRQCMEQFVTGIVNKKVGLMLLKLAGIRETELACEVAGTRRKKLQTLFCGLAVTVKGTNSFEQAQVCAGGVDFAEVRETLESVRMPGLFFAGEMLDIDGICGGYNLQWAWSSGAVAGRVAGSGEETFHEIQSEPLREKR